MTERDDLQSSAGAPLAAERHPLVRWATTALLGAACAVLAALLWQARTEVRPPQPVTAVSLRPSASALFPDGPPPDRRVVRPPRGHRLVLLLAHPGGGGGEPAAAEIFPPTGEGPARIVEVTHRDEGAVAVDLGTNPAPGRYRIVLHASGDDDSRTIATYSFRIGLAEPARPSS